jgi:hypothetical protein
MIATMLVYRRQSCRGVVAEAESRVSVLPAVPSPGCRWALSFLGSWFTPLKLFGGYSPGAVP